MSFFALYIKGDFQLTLFIQFIYFICLWQLSMIQTIVVFKSIYMIFL